jgi:hypothetical protein
MKHEKLTTLINQTKFIHDHQKEKKKLKGESFNVFSILGMERKENETHSAFICELLNPDGSHLMGNMFLSLFLSIIPDNSIDIETANVKTEHAIGKRNVKDKTGGRIDIFIWDRQGNSLSIENKIDAGDQEKQIERYFNFNKEKNSVYYLTLDGKEASKESKGELSAGNDYYTISYKKEVIEWLDLCLKEAVEQPILRESIKQYQVLLKKLTHSMDKKEQKELYDLIINNHEESAIIANNYSTAVGHVLNDFRTDLRKRLVNEFGDGYNVRLSDENVQNKFSHIWIKIKGKDELTLFFGITSFSIGTSFSLRIAVFNMKGSQKDYLNTFETKAGNWWYAVQEFSPIDYQGESYPIHLNNSRVLKRIAFDQEFRSIILSNIMNETKQYLKDYHERVASLLASL